MNDPRFHVDLPLAAGAELTLPAGAARHVQVLRLQPGMAITLFDGRGGQWRATISRMTSRRVDVIVGAHEALERETPWRVHLATGLFAVDRMDWLIEKATELGAASLIPVRTARSNVAVARVEKRQQRWQAISARACEQCGRNRLLHIHPPTTLAGFLQSITAPARWMLAPRAGKASSLTQLSRAADAARDVVVLSGPEGGLTDAEEAAAVARQFIALGLGPRILRAETAPLAVLGALLVAGRAGPASRTDP